MLYRLFRQLTRLALHLFFRRIDVEGRSNVPPAGPVLIVPNHTNAFVDPLVIITALRRPIMVTAKSALARNPLLRWLMSALRVVTFQRPQDAGQEGTDQRHNVRSMQRCREMLAAGAAVCIFPEGVSHSDPKLREFKAGAAKIALDFLRKDGNPGRLQIVPVGLLYTEKDRMRSDIWLRFGAPIDLERWLKDHPDGAHGNIDALTKEIRQRVERLTLNFETRRESAILNWAAEIVATGGESPLALGRAEPSPADFFQLTARVRAGYQSLLPESRDELDRLSKQIRRYRAELRRRGIGAPEVYLPIHFGRALLFLVREMELIVVGAPMALVGAATHAVPYWTVRQLARRLSKDKDHWASNVIYPGLVVFPLYYLIAYSAAWLLLPAFWAVLFSVAMPYTGYYALLYGNRFSIALRRCRTFLYFLFHRSVQQRLAAEGREIIAHIRALAQRADARQPEPRDHAQSQILPQHP
ncbi:MAG TPA: lysophospholipid acyltransferase family protein [Pirellulales bacterium]|jgi:1-acyl-sn-glycerol-3-phosphate acyltransferase|nr:lysophospholipid acyltransferase family protein [Pirellulales bacterium]